MKSQIHGSKKNHRTGSAYAVLVFAGLLLLAGIALTGCGSGDTSPGEENHDEQAEEGILDEGDVVRLTSAELEEFAIEVLAVGPGTMNVEMTFPGEVRVNQDRYAHVVPRVPGVVRSVFKSVGDRVRAGEVMAVLESRELADVKSSYLAALERLELARASFEREERLFEKKISSEQEYLEARQTLAEARIVLRADRQKLRALGFADDAIERLPEEAHASLIEYPLPAPFTGTVVEKHIVQGEALEADASAFDVADLSVVWVDLNIYQKDLALVREGQDVVISAGYDLPDARGAISYVRPIVGEETRTALARIILPNPDGLWRPGMFVNGIIGISEVEVPLAVPKTALQTIDGQGVIFVRTAEGFVPKPVTTGREDESRIEITSGLAAGDEYVARGGFALKSQLQKGERSEGHAH